ncbi:MAG: methyltransferase [Pseudomonadota bacterium]
MVAAPDAPRRGLRNWVAGLVAQPQFQALASRLPIGRQLAKRDGAEIFDILQGFVASQVLFALIELDILQRLLDHGPETPEALGPPRGIAPERMAALLQAGASLGLLARRRNGRYAIGRKGAAILGVPGLTAMIQHNRAFYADMADPLALLRGAQDTHLARFWPYVFGSPDIPAEEAERYSDLMAQSQVLVAQDTLRQVDFRGIGTLLDVGGGSGAFIEAVLRKHQGLTAEVLDLPNVLPAAEARFNRAGMRGRVTLRPGSFRTDALPQGADAISLIRVLYDHSEDTVRDLLAKVFAALPPGGRLIVSEPMAGGDRPERAGDVYFAFYTMAMGTGRARSSEHIGALVREAGFDQVAAPKPARPFVTSVLTCRKPG